MEPVVAGTASLAIERAGPDAGLPIVFLHAGVADARMWSAPMTACAERHPTLAYDRRGFGRTRVASAEPYAHVDDLWAVMDAAGFERALLVGCSQGGRIALDAALAHPERVAGLVLIAPAVSGAPDAEGFSHEVQELLDAHVAADAAGDPTQLNEIEARIWLDGVLAPPGRVQGAARELFLGMNGIALAAGDVGEARAAPSAWERLGTLRAPALVVWGPFDFEHLQSRCEHLVTALPRARGLVIEGTAHLPSVERPAIFQAALEGFIEELG